MAIMLRSAFLFVILTVAAGAQQTTVAEGYHVVHPEKAVATPAASTEKTAAKKTAAKKKHAIKSVTPGK
ncbi:MAG: hypothetical protein JWO80_4152 [Bryobacterales bacterium]|nr:hypothetical protein [Bryobacterales bacterium]